MPQENIRTEDGKPFAPIKRSDNSLLTEIRQEDISVNDLVKEDDILRRQLGQQSSQRKGDVEPLAPTRPKSKKSKSKSPSKSPSKVSPRAKPQGLKSLTSQPSASGQQMKGATAPVQAEGEYSFADMMAQDQQLKTM